jgi:hypothetical protein
MVKMTCPRCGEPLLAERHPWVLSDDGNGKTRVFDSARWQQPLTVGGRRPLFPGTRASWCLLLGEELGKLVVELREAGVVAPPLRLQVGLRPFEPAGEVLGSLRRRDGIGLRLCKVEVQTMTGLLRDGQLVGQPLPGGFGAPSPIVGGVDSGLGRCDRQPGLFEVVESLVASSWWAAAVAAASLSRSCNSSR